MNLENIIGNQDTKELLTKIVQLGQVSHSYMFMGIEGIGKALFAKAFAKMLLCINDAKEKPCNNCKSCVGWNSHNHPDYYELTTDETSIKIEQIRMLQSKLLEKPIMSQRKVYIINDADKMTKEAQNALLKTLEEPPEYVCIILIVSNENAILNTIKSRCTKIIFQPIEKEILQKYLQEECGIHSITQAYIQACGGSIKKALEMDAHKEVYQEIDQIFYYIEEFSLLDVLGKIEALYKNKEMIGELLEYLNTIFFEKAKKDKKYLSYMEKVEHTKRKIKANANYDMSIDSLLLSIFS